MNWKNIGLIFGLLMIVSMVIVIINIGMYIDNAINNDMSEEQVDEVYTQAKNGTLLRHWDIVFFPCVFVIALVMSYKRKNKSEVVKIGVLITICSLSLMLMQSGVRTCVDSCIGCQSWEESFVAMFPGVLYFIFFIIGIVVMRDGLDI